MFEKIVIYPREENQHQRIHLVSLDSWESLEFLRPAPSDKALFRFRDIYQQYLVPACPWIFKSMVLFRLPEDITVPYPMDGFSEALTAAGMGLKKGMTLRGGKPHFRDEMTRRFYEALDERGCVSIVRGKFPGTQFIPVGDFAGSLEDAAENAKMAVNASFFIMDPFDCATPHDHVGIPLGLMVKDGVVENPPLYHREALVVKNDGSVSITIPKLESMTIRIGNQDLQNPTIFTRPERKRTPRCKGRKITIVGRQVVAVSDKPSVPIPAAGFVLLSESCAAKPGDKVTYLGMENVAFAIQVGNSLMRSGEKTTAFISRFYNIYHLQPVPYPPCLYPLDFQKARAARIVLGADKDGKPMLLWAEGKAKLGHDPQKDSCGASLAELAEICEDLGMVNAVNLDGGGSAQLLLGGKRSLHISDRNPKDFSDAPRPVPLGLVVK